MNEIVVVQPKAESLVESAKRGLIGELSALSAPMYLRAVEDFLQYAQEVGREAFSDTLSVLFSDYLRYLRETGLSASTIQAKRVQLRRFFEWCVRVGLINQAALLDVKSVKGPKAQGGKAGNWIDDTQMQQLINMPDPSTLQGRRDRAILAVFMGTAMRRGEVANLTWGQIVAYGNGHAIRDLSRKHGRTQAYVALPEFVVRAIEQYSERGKDNEYVFVNITKYSTKGTSITTTAIYQIVKKYAAQAGFKSIAPHDLRRSWARSVSRKGLDIKQISHQMGHGSITVTERYINEILDVESVASVFNLEV